MELFTDFYCYSAKGSDLSRVERATLPKNGDPRE